ncbi:MAG: sugar phosphate nucleotidyltransferase [Candidatus Micrarchaeota archaeon]
MERITITIDDELLRFVDAMVSSGKAKNRSHAVDLLIRAAAAQSIVKTAVVLAAGKKDKLWSEEHGVIKPLVEIEGKTIIERVLLKLKNSGVTRVIIAIGYSGEQIVDKVKDGASFGLNVEYLQDENNRGSAGVLLLCKSKINEPFLLSYSDIDYPELDIFDLIKFHRERAANAVCTIALVNVKTPNVFGVAKLTGSKIVSFTEKPRLDANSNLVNAGIAVCEPSIFSYISKTPSSFEKELLPLLAEKDKLYGYIYSGKWLDIDLAP